MASLSVTNTFSSGATITASGHNQNFSDIVNYVNNRNSGSSTWDAVSSSSTSNVPLVCNNSTGTQNIANFQDNGSNVFSIADGSVVMTQNSQGIGIGATPSQSSTWASNTYVVLTVANTASAGKSAVVEMA